MSKGYSKGKAWDFIANCRYDKTREMQRLDCAMSDEQKANAPITKARNSAIDAFQQIPKNSRDGRKAARWIKFIRGERQGFEARCEYQANVEWEYCRITIDRAHKNKAFTGGELIIEDEKCLQYVERYEREYIVKKTDDSQ